MFAEVHLCSSAQVDRYTERPRTVANHILLTMTTFSLADAKAHLSRLVARVSGRHERVYVTVHRRRTS
jgi:hypothetical protein